MENLPLYNSRIIDTYIKLIKRKYSYVNVSALLEHAHMKAYEVADEGHWFTQKQVDRFYEKLLKTTRVENIAREAGRYSASPDALGVMRQYLLGLVGPSATFALLRQVTANFVKSSVYESKRLASDKVEITVTPQQGVHEKPYQCENRIGIFEAIFMMFNHRLPEISHPECLFKGGKVCRYIIKWENTRSGALKKLRNLSIASSCIIVPAVALFASPAGLGILLPVSLSVVLFIALLTALAEKKELRVAMDNVTDSTDRLLEQISVNYNNALVTNEIGQSISKQLDPEEILENVVPILEKRLDYDRGLILLANPENTRLIFRKGFGYSKEQSRVLEKSVFHLDRPESKGIFVVSFREQRPFLINDFNEIESTLSENSLAFARKMGTQSFICCPIISDKESIGILAVDNVKSKKPLIQSDMSLLMGIAHVIGISVRNGTLVEAKFKQFESMLQVLAVSIDARDSLTAGHSEKVTEYALGICHELRLAHDYCEMIRVASLLHDYGKIGVPDSILKKPGRLTEEEYEIVKSHASRSREILEQINFEGVYHQVPVIAGSHHEKIDGSGYPRGLKGKEIPYGAKIIAVADFFEAITAKRHYRGPMPFTTAMRLLQERVGTHFDERIVNGFLRYLKKSGIVFPEGSTGRLIVIDRYARRVPYCTPVSINLNGKVRSGRSMNISTKGIFVAVGGNAMGDIGIREGGEVQLSFCMPEAGSAPCITKGRIAWINSMSQRKKRDVPAGFGAEFVDLPNPPVQLKSFVDSYPMEDDAIGSDRAAGL
jgi:HD-GYP domain-containing protein (c-di-GMP phosphodiesterase class II)